MRLALSTTLLALAATAAAQDTTIVGTRSLGMGGTGVASADDVTVQYHNPGILGFMGRMEKAEAVPAATPATPVTETKDGKAAPPAAFVRSASDNNNLGRKDFGLGIDAQVGVQLRGTLADQLDKLDKIDYKKIGQNGIQNQQDARDLLTTLDSFKSLADPGNGFTADATGGLGIRIGHFAVGARFEAQTVGYVQKIDLQNIGIGLSGAALATQVNTNAAAPGGYTPTLLTPAQQAQLATALGGGVAGTDAVKALDYQASQAGITQAQISGLFPDLITVANGAATSLDNNTTSVTAYGYGIGEVPVSYGVAFGDHLAIGVTGKYMVGRVYATNVLVFNKDSQNEIKKVRENYQQTSQFGVDAGVIARMPYLQVGLTGRNLNNPTFKGPTIAGIKLDDVTIDRQFTAGAAFLKTWSWFSFTLAGDVDLNRTKSLLPGVESQKASGGVEFVLARFLSIRAGAYKNLAYDQDPLVVTAGVGFDLWAMRIDLAAAAATETATWDGEKYPKEGRVAAQFAIDF